jgi:NDP-sugar pyrophosphorylase family protein
MLDYSIEFLAGGGVEEIHIIARSHVSKACFCDFRRLTLRTSDRNLILFPFPQCEQVIAHIEGSKFARMENLTIQVHCQKESYSEGDVLRFMEETEAITSDFILIHGDVVSNMSLERLMKEHESRLERDKKSIMTMVFKKAPASCASRSSVRFSAIQPHFNPFLTPLQPHCNPIRTTTE